MKPRPAEPWSKTWFMRTPGFRMYMLRELTSVFVLGYLVFLIVLVHRMGQGYESYLALMDTLRHPLAIAGHILVLVAACFHTITWFNLTPSIMPARIGEEKVPDALVAIGTGYLPWAVVSLLVAWWLLRSGSAAA